MKDGVGWGGRVYRKKYSYTTPVFLYILRKRLKVEEYLAIVVTVASNLLAMASIVVAMASNLLAMTRVPKRSHSCVPKRSFFCVPKRLTSLA